MKIAFLIYRSTLGGGTYVVYQHALYLKQAGHDVTIVTLTDESPFDDIWHPGIPELKFAWVGDLDSRQFDLAIGTLWSTMLHLHRVPSDRYAYFVQSIESRFYPESDHKRRSLIDAIYAWRVPGITEATWIRDYLKEKYDSDYFLVFNGIRKDLYCPDGSTIARRDQRRPRILVEGAFGAIKNTARAISTARRAGGSEIWLLTTTDIPWFPGVSKVFRNVPVDQVGSIYRSCDLILKLSLVEGMFGPPLEMFHCGGTAVVYNVTGHEEYIAHEKNALVVPMHDEQGVIGALRRLIDDRALMNQLKAGAMETAAAWPNWDSSSRDFEKALESLVLSEAFTRERLVLQVEELKKAFSDDLFSLPPQRQSAVSPTRKHGPMAVVRSQMKAYRTFWGHVAESY